MNNKTVSVIIPNYNYADFIEERIDSIIRQKYPISELIILDDASTDNSIEIIKRKISRIAKIRPGINVRLVVNEKNSGGCVFSQWQKGLREATGDYVWIAEADDSSNKEFLEEAMRGFEKHPDAVLFYSDSCRIDGKGKVIASSCIDWVDIWNNGRWKQDYYNNGEDEIRNYLSANNTIINVSCVVWKNQDCLNEFFEEAKGYKIAGDWHIYARVLGTGNVVYSSRPLNYYRKHNKGSVSTVVSLMREYKEVYAIQEWIRNKYDLKGSLYEWQRKRRRMMGFVENEKNINKKGRIAWFIPDFVDGSGGHRTIFQNAERLIKDGYACDLYVKTVYSERKPIDIYNDIVRWYDDYDGDVFIDYDLTKDYDIIFATSWDTARPVLDTGVKNKMYFIQDFEPWFFPMSEDYLKAKESYKYGFKGVSIGRWLSAKINDEFGAPMRSFSFCADHNIYKDVGRKREQSICFIYQPSKPRRCAAMGLKALQIVQEKRPDIKIYLYGSPKKIPCGLKAEHLGVLTAKECNNLYNKCSVGLCLSSSNPSRIPFEMMMAGLPVVDLCLENNLYDLPEDGCLLAEPSAEAIATAILELFEDEDLRKRLAEGGHKYMKDYPLERGFDEFVARINNYGTTGTTKLTKTYKRAAVKPEFSAIEKNDVYFLDLQEGKSKKTKLSIPRRIYLKIRYKLFGW